MNIVAYARYIVEDPSFSVNVPHAIISIKTPHDNDADIALNQHNLGVLRVSFPDLDKDFSDCFSDQHARMIWDFVLKHKNTADMFIVHCDMGMSRSPGVAAAIAKIFIGDDTMFFKTKTPNMRVYRIMLDVWHNEYIDKQ